MALYLNLIFAVGLLLVLLCMVYLWTLALASLRSINEPKEAERINTFAIAIPAHNEENVIANTVATLFRQNYPKENYRIFVVADHCTDKTAQVAHEQGAECFERLSGEQGGKASALRWLFEKIFNLDSGFDAFVIFDADTQVDLNFLTLINDHLNRGASVVQGQHIISNPHQGWFPRLTWAMMKIDNRYSNQSRHNLRLSAKHMGDSICIKSEIIKQMGWGSGLTEDFDFRLRMLLEGICIHYEPEAKGYGQAASNLREAHAQRLRWAKGMTVSRQRYRKQLISNGIRRRDWSQLDGAIGTIIPSFSTLTLLSVFAFVVNIAFNAYLWRGFIITWSIVVLLWLVYPLVGLLLENAPSWAYLAIFTGPVFIFWRTWINIKARIKPKDMAWVRTPHENIQ